MVARQVELLPHSVSDPGSILTAGAACAGFVCSPGDRLGYLRVLRFQ